MILNRLVRYFDMQFDMWFARQAGVKSQWQIEKKLNILPNFFPVTLEPWKAAHTLTLARKEAISPRPQIRIVSCVLHHPTQWKVPRESRGTNEEHGDEGPKVSREGRQVV